MPNFIADFSGLEWGNTHTDALTSTEPTPQEGRKDTVMQTSNEDFNGYPDANLLLIRRVTDADAIHARDLQAEARKLDANRDKWTCEVYSVWDGEVELPETLAVLWVPSTERAGCCWGGDSDWTDAESSYDAAERYVGIDGKEMCP